MNLQKKKKRKFHLALCPISKNRLFGVSFSRSVPHSKRKPNRLFGGHLSSKVVDRIIRFCARIKAGEIFPSSVPLRLRKYVERVKL
ncbi:MAG: hypothetical protein QXW70_03150 [Candidatus Anstonellales archaeon]